MCSNIVWAYLVGFRPDCFHCLSFLCVLVQWTLSAFAAPEYMRIQIQVGSIYYFTVFSFIFTRIRELSNSIEDISNLIRDIFNSIIDMFSFGRIGDISISFVALTNWIRDIFNWIRDISNSISESNNYIVRATNN